MEGGRTTANAEHVPPVHAPLADVVRSASGASADRRGSQRCLTSGLPARGAPVGGLQV